MPYKDFDQMDMAGLRVDLSRSRVDLGGMVPDLGKALAGPDMRGGLVQLALGSPSFKVSQALQASRVAYQAPDFANFNSRFTEAVSGLRSPLRGLTAAMAQAASGMGAATSPSAAAALQSIATPGPNVAAALGASDRWRPALMRWSLPPTFEVIRTNQMEFAQAVSRVAVPQIGWAATQASRDLRRSPLIAKNVLGTEPLIASFPLAPPELPAEWPEVEPEPREKEAPAPESAPAESDAAPERDPELLRRIEALERSQNLGLMFMVIVGGKLIGGTIQDYIWEYTPAGEYIDFVLKEIIVQVEGVHYILPYIVPH